MARGDLDQRVTGRPHIAALIALLLPWTTTGVIFALLALLIAFAFIELREFRRALLRPICMQPIALFVLLPARCGLICPGRFGGMRSRHRSSC
jgi:hypothetical protein